MARTFKIMQYFKVEYSTESSSRKVAVISINDEGLLTNPIIKRHLEVGEAKSLYLYDIQNITTPNIIINQ